MPLRLIFMGTPDFAVPTLLDLVAHGHEIVAVYTRVAKPAGRGMKLQLSPVEREARRLGIPVVTPATLKTAEALEEFRAHAADAAMVVAYGMILPQAILDAPKLGCFNLHGSLLPRWRGAAPINRAIMAGDAETGVMVMKMDAGLDTGDVAMAERLTITDAMTAADLHDALAPLGADLMVRAMGALERGKLQLTKQSDQGVTYAAKIDKAEARIDWHKPARAVLRHIHGLSPFPGAWCEMPIEGEPVRVKILRCELAQGSGAVGDLLDDRLRRRRDPDPRTAARRQGADEGCGFSARNAAEGGRKSAMIIRQENPADVDAIRAVIREAFGGAQEADLVDRLRSDNDLLVSLVAEQDGQIIGHVGFSRIWIVEDGRRVPGVGLAPLAVLPEHQRRGVATTLVEAGHVRLRHDGESIVFVLGAPKYYGRFGFSVSSAAPFSCVYAGSHFQALSFSSLAPETGSLSYPLAFSGLR
jgi:methionyl-tRNA formyltransferase